MTKQNALIAATVVSLLAALPGVASAASPAPVPPSTPMGLTLRHVTYRSQLLWTRLADANGKPLYTFDSDTVGGAPTCVGACTKDFEPYISARGAVATGDWTLVAGEGGRQWAYQGKPLYRYTGQDPNKIKETSTGDRGLVRTDGLTDPASDAFSPKAGWRAAAFIPEPANPTPAGIEMASLPVANGYGFILAQTKLPLYVMKSSQKNPNAWTPAYAPALGLPVGDFTIVMREDGKPQWAYKNQPLFTNNDDHSDTDLSGALVEKDAEPALAYRHFQPRDITVGFIPTRGPIMTTAKGMTVYTQARYSIMYGGRETRDGYRPDYNDGKAVGGKGCVDACLKTWTPVAAPADAQSSGYWEVITRPDGSKQWAYKGVALYTNKTDKKPGDTNGNNIHDVVFGETNTPDFSVAVGDVRGAGAGFYWRTVTFFN